MHTPTYLSHTGACINHFPSYSAAVYYHDDKTVPGLPVMMICAVSSQQLHFQSLLVQEQIGNIEGRVGMCSPQEMGGRSWFVTWRWLLGRQMITSAPWWSPRDIEMDGVEMESGWLVTTLHSVWDSNVTGGDGHHLCSPSFNSNDKGGCHSFLCSL